LTLTVRVVSGVARRVHVHQLLRPRLRRGELAGPVSRRVVPRRTLPHLHATQHPPVRSSRMELQRQLVGCLRSDRAGAVHPPLTHDPEARCRTCVGVATLSPVHYLLPLLHSSLVRPTNHPPSVLHLHHVVT
jgi:hypothetical protein